MSTWLGVTRMAAICGSVGAVVWADAEAARIAIAKRVAVLLEFIRFSWSEVPAGLRESIDVTRFGCVPERPRPVAKLTNPTAPSPTLSRGERKVPPLPRAVHADAASRAASAGNRVSALRRIPRHCAVAGAQGRHPPNAP